METFLAALAECGIVREAARQTGVSHGVTAFWKRTVPGFAERYEAARQQGRVQVAPQAEQTLFKLGVVGVVEVIRDKRGNIVWDPIDADGNDVPPNKKPAAYRKATRRVYDVRALLRVLEAVLPDKYGSTLSVKADVNHTNDETDRVKRLMADRESLDLAITLARRLAVQPGGDGQSAN